MQGFLLKNYKDLMIEIDVKYIAELNGIQKGKIVLLLYSYMYLYCPFILEFITENELVYHYCFTKK